MLFGKKSNNWDNWYVYSGAKNHLDQCQSRFQEGVPQIHLHYDCCSHGKLPCRLAKYIFRTFLTFPAIVEEDFHLEINMKAKK